MTSFHGTPVAVGYLVAAICFASLVHEVEGIELDGVFIYRTIEVLYLKKSRAKRAKKDVVIRGGLLGFEAVKVFLDLGVKETHIIQFAPRLMPRQIYPAISDMLKGKFEILEIHTSTNIRHIRKDTLYHLYTLSQSVQQSGKYVGYLFW